MTDAIQTETPHPDAYATPQKIAVLVEDDVDILGSNTRTFEHWGYKVHAFENGKLALDYFTGEGQADLLLTDNDMPVMTGIELLRQLDSQDKVAKTTILNSGRSSPALKAEVENLGAKFLEKPYKLQVLKDTIAANDPCR